MTGDPVPADGFPAAPVFSCCESDFAAKQPPPPRASNREYTTAAGAKASEVTVYFKVEVDFSCAVLPGNDCRGTFSAVNVTRHPQLRLVAGPADPVSHRVWWNADVQRCNGAPRKSQLMVLYVARFDGRGVPAGNTPQNLVLELRAPRAADNTKKGTDYALTIELSQDNLKESLVPRIKEFKPLP